MPAPSLAVAGRIGAAWGSAAVMIKVAVLRTWREALLAHDTLRHVGFSIFMVETAMEKVIVVEIGGSITQTGFWRQWSQPGVR